MGRQPGIVVLVSPVLKQVTCVFGSGVGSVEALLRATTRVGAERCRMFESRDAGRIWAMGCGYPEPCEIHSTASVSMAGKEKAIFAIGSRNFPSLIPLWQTFLPRPARRWIWQ